jgi:uncharacterized protein (TIGR03382 family)
VYSAIAVLMAWPLIRAFASVVPHDAGDPILNSWILWWSTLRTPFTSAWWNAPMFFPMRDAMALSEVLVGILPISAPVQALTGNPVAAYNAAFLLSFPLCGLAAYALAFELTGHSGASLAAGIAYAFAPYRLGQFAHLQVLSYYWAPLVFLGLHRYLRADTAPMRDLALFAVAWVMQSLSNGYAMFHVSVLIGLWIIWFARPLRRAVPIAIAWAAGAAVLAPLLLHYERVHRALHLVRDINEVKRYSADLVEVLSPSPELVTWGGRLVAARAETTVFPGATILVAAAVAAFAWRMHRRRPQRTSADPVQRVAAAVAIGAGLVAASALTVGPWAIPGIVTVTVFHKPFTIAFLALTVWLLRTDAFRRAWHTQSRTWFYVLAAILMYVLALGPLPTAGGYPLLYEPPYAWLMRLPGFSVLRVPARFAMVAVLCQSAALSLWLARWNADGARRWAVAVICAGLLIDGWARMPVVAVPTPPPRWDAVDAVIELPAGEPARDFPAIYRAMVHGRPIANGFSGYAPAHYLPLAFALREHRFDVLQDLAPTGRIGVSVEKSGGSEELVRELAAQPFARPGDADARWSTFIVEGRPLRPPRVGASIAFTVASAHSHPEDTGRLHDGNIETAWAAGDEQGGSETLVLDAGHAVDIGAIVFGMGAFAFGFPRELAVDVSPDGAAWAEVWRGRTAAETLRAALREPGVVPLTVEIGRASGRYVRLRQLGREPGIPWWIAEFALHAPVAGER